MDIPQRTISDWLSGFSENGKFTNPPESRQHYNVWNFAKSDSDSTAWDRWLDCHTQQQIASEMGVEHSTIHNWIVKFSENGKFDNPPESRQHFDIWQFSKSDSDSTAWDRWLNCYTQAQIASEIGIDYTTVKNWIGKFCTDVQNSPPEL